MSEEQRKKNDLRIRYTQQILKEHLLLLLNTKPLGKITVKELCASAGVNRTTFYTHYADIYDLMQRIKDQMKEDILLHIKTYSHLGDAEKKGALIGFLHYLRKNKYLYLLLCEESGPDSLREYTWRTTRECYLDEAHQNTPPLWKIQGRTSLNLQNLRQYGRHRDVAKKRYAHYGG